MANESAPTKLATIGGALYAIDKLVLLLFGQIQLHIPDWIFARVGDMKVVQSVDIDIEYSHYVSELCKLDWIVVILRIPDNLWKYR